MLSQALLGSAHSCLLLSIQHSIHLRGLFSSWLCAAVLQRYSRPKWGCKQRASALLLGWWGRWRWFSQKDRLPIAILSEDAYAWEGLFPPDCPDDSPRDMLQHPLLSHCFLCKNQGVAGGMTWPHIPLLPEVVCNISLSVRSCDGTVIQLRFKQV